MVTVVRGQRVGEVGLVRVTGEVDDAVERLLLEHRRDRVRVRAVDGVPGAVGAVGLRDQVQADDLVTAVGEADGDDAADAAGRAGDEHPHAAVTVRSSGA